MIATQRRAFATLLLCLAFAGVRVASAQSNDGPADPQRPTYHIVTPRNGGAVFDPNGAIYWKGRYHLMYIVPNIGWQHISSTDLLHWRKHPDLGMFSNSGGAFVNRQGVPTIIAERNGIEVVVVKDDELNQWEVISLKPWPKPEEADYTKYNCWDPTAWVEGDTHLAIFGCHPFKRPTPATVFKSSDLRTWEYVGPLMARDMPGVEPYEDISCPDLFQIGDRHMLLCISHVRGCRYYLGRFENAQFHPESHGRMNWPGGTCFAPETLLDGKGRRIMWAWALDRCPEADLAAADRGGTLTLPRVLSLAPDRTLRIEPAEELQTLRSNRRHEQVAVPAGGESACSGIRGDCLEIGLQVPPGISDTVGLKVRCSPGGEERTTIAYDPKTKRLRIDFKKASLDSRITYGTYAMFFDGAGGGPKENPPVTAQEAPFELAPNEPLRLRVFIDHSILEVFANERQCLTQCIYPTRTDSLDVRLFSQGTAIVVDVDAWDMSPVTIGETENRADASQKAEPGFTSLFDGRTLDGWESPDMSYWSVEDGAVTAKITESHPCTVNQYLVWREPMDDFELKLDFRVTGSPGVNGGFQFRSRLLPGHDMAGYQMDNNRDTPWLARLYEEHGRETLAFRGTSAIADADGKITSHEIPDAAGPPWFQLENWHEYDLTCQGSHLTLKIDGRLAAEVVDNDAAHRALSGLLGLQLHSGPPMTVQFKNVRFKKLAKEGR